MWKIALARLSRRYVHHKTNSGYGDGFGFPREHEIQQRSCLGMTFQTNVRAVHTTISLLTRANPWSLASAGPRTPQQQLSHVWTSLPIRPNTKHCTPSCDRFVTTAPLKTARIMYINPNRSRPMHTILHRLQPQPTTTPYTKRRSFFSPTPPSKRKQAKRLITVPTTVHPTAAASPPRSSCHTFRVRPSKVSLPLIDAKPNAKLEIATKNPEITQSPRISMFDEGAFDVSSNITFLSNGRRKHDVLTIGRDDARSGAAIGTIRLRLDDLLDAAILLAESELLA